MKSPKLKNLLKVAEILDNHPHVPESVRGEVVRLKSRSGNMTMPVTDVHLAHILGRAGIEIEDGRYLGLLKEVGTVDQVDLVSRNQVGDGREITILDQDGDSPGRHRFIKTCTEYDYNHVLSLIKDEYWEALEAGAIDEKIADVCSTINDNPLNPLMTTWSCQGHQDKTYRDGKLIKESTQRPYLALVPKDPSRAEEALNYILDLRSRPMPDLDVDHHVTISLKYMGFPVKSVVDLIPSYIVDVDPWQGATFTEEHLSIIRQWFSDVLT